MSTKVHIHDAYFNKIEVANGNAFLGLSREGSNLVIELRGVTFLMANQFLVGNIILDAYYIKVQNAQNLRDDLADALQEGYINDELLQKAWENDMYYFELNPSYGCYLRAICGGVITNPFHL